jgi:hypothetical protein
MIGCDLILSHPVVNDPTDYKGLPAFVEGNAEFVPFSELKSLINATERTIFFLDDLGQASPAVQAAAMQLILARQVNGHRVSDNVCFVAATNRRVDKSGVAGFLEALKSRFTIFELEPSVEDWEEWALNQPWMPLSLIGACKFKPQWLNEWKPANKGAIANSPCPRNIAEVGKIMNLGLSPSLEFMAYAGRIGSGAATELKAYLDLINDMPTVDEIVANPMNTKIPAKMDSRYAIIAALTERSEENNFSNIVRYVERVGAEYLMLYMQYIAKRKQKLQASRIFIDFAIKNKLDVVNK